MKTVVPCDVGYNAEALEAVYTRPNLADYRDFTHQHAATNLFDQGEYAGALAYFDPAAELRRRRGNPELLASAEHAIAVTRQRLALMDSSSHHPDQDYG